ncbi:Y-family DNA polymerase [Sutcliffiella cohnii]|uniref:UV damage repair protein UvrX n=1 Tax=Sutcliffiella cohnii TaxID=33932 RepID=A0A223KSA4_9BACI|nr:MULTISPECIES: UV damage repair protein UvrX [Sutcliffiella]AST92360.1 UV damage repair protein UvrX [Sutcliffiella cohnii]MED4017177.1 UV damage repair protein UvrX [Sutcliffiella cohnii]WBL17633.1 UV damage repair protein UvrX [Sutcliffiella sp. NC1]
MPNNKTLCVDMKSFYASCSAVMLGLDPMTCYLAVVGNTERQGSVVLAASPKLKKEFGIKTGSRRFEIPNDRRIQVVNPQMATYLRISTEITRLFNRYVPKESIHTYSVDESFLQVDGVESIWGDAETIAWKIKDGIEREFQLPCAVGIGPNMLMSKLCLDLEAKKKGVAEWTYSDVKTKLWKVSPLREMWGIGSRVEKTLNRMGIFNVGQLANYPLELLEKKFGIMGNQLYHHAWGIDFSQPGAPLMQGQISFGKSQILLRDYHDPKEIKRVLLEICEEVARRARQHNKAGRTVSLGIGYSKEEFGGGFHRSKTIESPTNITMDIYETCLELFEKFYEGKTVRQISVSLSNIVEDSEIQLSLFELDRPKRRQLGYVMDQIRHKHGSASLLRAVSYTAAGTAKHRSTLVGGHKA